MATRTSNTAAVKAMVAKLRDAQRLIHNAIDAGMAEHAEAVVDLAKQLSPVRTGFNRDHISSLRENYAKYKVVASSPYAAALELGTSHMAAEPFLFPASEALRALLKARLLSKLKQG